MVNSTNFFLTARGPCTSSNKVKILAKSEDIKKISISKEMRIVPLPLQQPFFMGYNVTLYFTVLHMPFQ